MCVRREQEKDAGWSRVDTKQRPSFGSVQLQSDPMGDLYHEPHWVCSHFDSSLTIPTCWPLLCNRGGWLEWVEMQV